MGSYSALYNAQSHYNTVILGTAKDFGKLNIGVDYGYINATQYVDNVLELVLTYYMA